MRVLGIDFGTSNTVGMLRLPDGRLRPLLFDGSPLLPSAVYLGTDGRMLIGRDAERHARLDPSRFEPNPKRRVDDGHVFLGDREMTVAQVFGHVLSQVAGEARRQLGAPPQEVRLTHPARWGELRRGTLVEAARIAGLGTPRLIAEPVAAASYFTAVLGAQVPVGRSLAIYDLGGGTFDATVVRRTQSGFDVLAEEGLPDVGGLDFDHAVVEHLGTTYRASHGAAWDRLLNPTDSGDRRSRRMLYEDVRGAKEMLSRTASADIHLPALEVDAHLTREEFEGLVRPYLERTITCLQRVIVDARVQPQELVGIFLVGGSSRIPLAAHLIHTALGVAPTTLEQPETVVVEGALCIGAARPSGPPSSGVPRQAAIPPRPMNQPGQPGMRPAGSPVRQRPVSTPPVQQRPVSTPPVSSSPRPVGPPPGQPVGQPAVSLQRGPRPPAGPYSPPPMGGRPVTPARPTTGPVPGQPMGMRPAGQQPRPMQAPAPRPMAPPPPRARAWYSEPTVLGTIGVLIIVLILFVVLLKTAFG